MTDSIDSTGRHEQDIVARAGRYYRNIRYIVLAGMVVVALWFAYDGWVRWPGERDRFNSLSRQQQVTETKPHSELDISLQKRITLTLLSAVVPMLAWFLYRSRGEYRLSETTLHVPGHPPVPFSSIVLIDKSKWDRKGIAFVEYQVNESGRTARLALDDFIYDRAPTDQIVARIEAWLKANEPAGNDEEASGSEAQPE